MDILTFLINHSPIFYFIQSLWRDEVFSILVAERPILSFITNLTFEPPVYYVTLHYWMKLFGNSEIATRSLSLLSYALACFVVIEWASTLFKKSWLKVLLPLLFFANPMLVYYAFEVRTYGMYMLFSTLSLYAFTQKKWRLYVLSSVLGFYTHTYFIFLFATQILFYLMSNVRQLSKVKFWIKSVNDPQVKAMALTLLCMAPWIVRVIIESAKLKQSWYFPVNINLVLSVLGNMFLGYEGTPWYMWTHTKYISAVLFILMIISLIPKKTRPRNSLFVLAIVIPLTIVIGVSFFKPLFVNRYLIYVSIALVFSVVYAIETVRNKAIQMALGISILLGCIWFNTWYPLQHPKTPTRSAVAQINVLRGDNDVVYATSSLVLFEAIYYSEKRDGVYLYNPSRSPFPWYVGDAIFSESMMTSDIPIYPKRAFLLNPDGTFSVAYQLPKPASVFIHSQPQP